VAGLWDDTRRTRTDKRIGAIIDSLRASGKSLDEIEAEWEGKNNTQILEEYALATS